MSREKLKLLTKEEMDVYRQTPEGKELAAVLHDSRAETIRAEFAKAMAAAKRDRAKQAATMKQYFDKLEALANEMNCGIALGEFRRMNSCVKL